MHVLHVFLVCSFQVLVVSQTNRRIKIQGVMETNPYTVKQTYTQVFIVRRFSTHLHTAGQTEQQTHPNDRRTNSALCPPYCDGDTDTNRQHYQHATDSKMTWNGSEPSQRHKRTILGRYPVCPRGCTSCSAVNGCVSCERRYYMFLYRQNIRQIGMCTPSCPPGYFGARHRHYSKCNRCQVPHCQICFSRHYCTRCYPPYFSHRGSCLEACPPGMHFANYSSECREVVDCLLGPWTSWSTCRTRGRRCNHRRGVKVRSRNILESPSPNGAACQDLEERRECRLTCKEICRLRKRHMRKRKRGRGRKWRKSRRRGRGRVRKNNRKSFQRRRCRISRGSLQRCRRRMHCPEGPG